MGKATKSRPGASYEAGKATEGGGLTLDHATGIPIPPTPSRRHHVRLNTIDDVKGELAKLYRQAKAGEIPTQDATRLGYLLNTLASLIVEHDHEKRLLALEQHQQSEG